jgi:hypothetical protein
MKHIVFIILVTISFCIPFNGFSENQEYERTINWSGVKKIEIAFNEYIPVLAFEGARYESVNNYLPGYFERISIGNPESFNVIIIDRIFETIPENEMLNIDGLQNVGNNIKINSHIHLTEKNRMPQFLLFR